MRAVAALASAYIARKDRVGLVEFGGYLRWLKPAAGRRQLEALLQAAVSADQVFTYMAGRSTMCRRRRCLGRRW